MMKTTAKLKIEVSNARIRKATIMADGTCKLEVEKATQKQNDLNENTNDDFVLIEASKLSLTDAFMSHKPQTKKEKQFKATLTKVIKNGIEDFYRPVMDPSFADKEKKKIHYMAGEEPAVGKSYNWWKKTVKNSDFCIGTKSQYVAFLGVLIKLLVDKGWTVDEAWNAVCNDSKKLGHYMDSDNAKHRFEDTGSREICGFFDLANTVKLLAEDEGIDGFLVVGGTYDVFGSITTLADFGISNAYNDNRNYSVAWLVLNKKLTIGNLKIELSF